MAGTSIATEPAWLERPEWSGDGEPAWLERPEWSGDGEPAWLERPEWSGDGEPAWLERPERNGKTAPTLDQLRRAVAPVSLAREQTLPVLSALEPLLPDGALERGSVAAVSGRGATSLALALAGGPSNAESWVAVVGLPTLGYVAAAGYGVGLDRLAVVARPEPSKWAEVVAALVDSLDVVLVAADQRVRAGDARRLQARVQDRGAVLIQVGGPQGVSTSRWPGRPDLEWAVTGCAWEGIADGAGHLRARRVTVEATGRRRATSVRRAELWLPDPDGRVTAVEPRAMVVDIGSVTSGSPDQKPRLAGCPSGGMTA